MTLAAEAERVDGAAMPDAGDDILQDAPARHVEQHVVGDDGADLRRGGHGHELVQPELVARPAAQGQRQMRPVAEDVRHPAQPAAAGRIGLVGHEHGDQALVELGDVLPAEQALRLAAPPLAERQQPAEAAIGWPVGGVDQERGAIGQVEPAADDQPHARGLRRLVRAHDAGEAVAVGDRQGLEAEHGCLGEQLLAGAGAAQERELRRALQLGVAHPNTPCRNQRCEPVPASSPSPSRNSQNRSPASVSTWK